MSKIKPEKQHSSFSLFFLRRSHQKAKICHPKKIKTLVIA